MGNVDLGGAASRAAAAQPAGHCLCHGRCAATRHRPSRLLGRTARVRNPDGDDRTLGVTHSLVAVLACLVVLRWEGLSGAVIDPLVVGYLSHLGGRSADDRWPAAGPALLETAGHRPLPYRLDGRRGHRDRHRARYGVSCTASAPGFGQHRIIITWPCRAGERALW